MAVLLMRVIDVLLVIVGSVYGQSFQFSYKRIKALEFQWRFTMIPLLLTEKPSIVRHPNSM